MSDTRSSRSKADDTTEAQPLTSGPPVHETETKHYSDGTSATGVPPLPGLSPGQQAEAEAEAAAIADAKFALRNQGHTLIEDLMDDMLAGLQRLEAKLLGG